MHEVIIDDTIRQGKEILAGSQPGDYTDNLKTSLYDLENRWNSVVEKTNERQQQLDEVAPPAQNYSEAMENFIPALSEMEDIVGDCGEVLCEKHALGRERDLLKVNVTGCFSSFFDCFLLSSVYQ